MIVKIILWVLGLFGYRKEAAAVAAYQAEGEKETAQAVEKKVAEIQQIQTRVQTRENQDHEEVAATADPNAAADALLRADGIIAADGKNDPGAGG